MNVHVQPNVTPALPPAPAPTIASLFQEWHENFTARIDNDAESDAAYDRARACELALMAMPTLTTADLARKVLVAIGDEAGDDGEPGHELSLDFIAEVLRPLAHTATADAELLALGEQFEAAWANEVHVIATTPVDDDESLNTARDASQEIAQRLVDLPATTIAGLRIKAMVKRWADSEDFDPNYEWIGARATRALARDLGISVPVANVSTRATAPAALEIAA